MADALPLVCACIPAYNAEATIGETLESILNQTYPNLEILVLDNASTDRTVEVVESFKDKRLMIHRGDTNMGAVGNFNRCIELASGKYTEIFHADEVYEPEIVARQVDVLEKYPEAGAAFTEGYLIDSRGAIFGETAVAKHIGRRRGETAILGFNELFPAIVRSGNFLLCSGAMVRTGIYKTEIRSWRLDLFRTSCDLDVWLRILERHSIALLLENLMRTRTTQTQASYQELKRNTSRADIFLVLDHYLAKSRSRDVLRERDLAGYAALQRMDTARRAMNLYLTGRRAEASDLLKGFLNWRIISNSFNSKRGLLTFLLALYLKVALLLRLDMLGVRILQSIVAKTRR